MKTLVGLVVKYHVHFLVVVLASIAGVAFVLFWISPTPTPPIAGQVVTFRPSCSAATTKFQQAFDPLSGEMLANGLMAGAPVRSLAMARDGLWIGYAGKGLGWYDGVYWQHCLEDGFVNSILPMPDGTVWVGLDPGDNLSAPALIRYKAEVYEDYSAGLPDRHVYDVEADSAGNIFVGTLQGIAVRHASDGSWANLPYYMILGSRVHAVRPIAGGDLLIGFTDQGGTWFHNRGNVWTKLGNRESGQSPVGVELGGMNVRKIVLDPSGSTAWIASDGGTGITLLDIGGMRTFFLVEPPVPATRILDIQFDWHQEPCIASLDGGTWCRNKGVWTQVSSTVAYAVAPGCRQCTVGEGYVFSGTALGVERHPLPK